MATIEEKIQSVIDGSAATNPYVKYKDMLDGVMLILNAITLTNNGDNSNGSPGPPIVLSTYEQIENEWNGWTEVDPISGDTIIHSGFLTDITNLQTEIDTIVNNCNNWYSTFWNGPNLNYKNRPALLNGVHQIRINVAIKDAGGNTLTEAEKQIIADAQYNDLLEGSVSFNPSSEAEIQTIINECLVIANSFGGNVTATEVSDVTTARITLGGVSSRFTTISNKLNAWFVDEDAQYYSSLNYATAYGATIFAIDHSTEPIVESLMGNLP